ncbi:MAG: cell division protein FtsL [Arenicella sp.]
MNKTGFFLLMGLLFVTSLLIVYTRHQHRIEYVKFNNSIATRDELNIEWNQLLVEESLWSFPHRVEKDATRSLSMRVPKAEDIVVLGELNVQQ